MKRVLICDDQPEIREALGMLLELEFDANISYASDGKECIDMLTNNTAYDLIICDVHMPRANGSDVYAHNLKGAQSPFIFLSGDDSKIKSLVQETGNTFFISKPWSDGTLIDIIRGVFGLKAA